MCGFAGAVVWDERYRVSPETLRRMTAAVAHRGPDGEARHLTREHDPITPETPQVALGFRRLAILDPDERSMQPFTDGRRWLVFNGEVYNFRDLRAELSDRNDWRTTGDTEVLLAAYAAWGERCVDRLNGMFAFAVWDEADKTLFLARDRMGQKPLYFCFLGGSSDAMAGIAFASELPALLRFEGIRGWQRAIDTSALTAYLQWGYTPDPATIHSGIRRLMPARTLCGGPDGFQLRRYFSPDPRPTPDGSAATDTRRLVTSAVRRQLVSDVPLGCFLSGGIDSSVIAAAMRAALPDGSPILTFSIGFDDARYDERRYAAEVSRHLGTTHHEFSLQPDVSGDLQALSQVFGEPFGDSSALPTQFLSRETRGLVKVALSGDGGDELFGGYDRYRAMATAHRLTRVTTRMPWKVLAPASRRLKAGHPKSLLTKVGRFLSSLGMPADRRYSSYMRLFDGDQVASLMKPMLDGAGDWTSTWGPTHNDCYGSSFGLSDLGLPAGEARRITDPVQASLALDRLVYLPGDLLVKTDRCSMLHGLEVRSPFMDHELVQFAAGLTTDQLLKGGPKRMLREAFAADLPAWVFKRKKMGFAVPIGDWFRGPLRAMLRETLFSARAFGRSHFDMAVVQRLVDDHESRRADHAQRLYALLMLELWWDTVRA